MRVRQLPNYDSACYHAQQSAEKYLKGRLAEAGLPFRKTHDLEELLNLILPIETAWTYLQAELRYLNGFAVDIRYPGADATKADAQAAVNACRRVRKVIRTALGLPV